MHDDPIDALYARAKQHGVPMATICARAKVHVTTPSRWRRKKNGATVSAVAALNDALSCIIEERSRAVA